MWNPNKWNLNSHQNKVTFVIITLHIVLHAGPVLTLTWEMKCTQKFPKVHNKQSRQK